MKEFIHLLSSDSVQNFVTDHEYHDAAKIILQNSEILNVPAKHVALQIEGRRKVKEKLPSWYGSHGIVYPPTINLEQSSSELTARYKASVLNNLLRDRNEIVDLTGGFGIDTHAFSQMFQRVIYVEPNTTLSAIAKHNHHVLGSNNIEHVDATAEDFIAQNPNRCPDAYYLDPSRRDATNKKVFLLKETVPDITTLLPLLLQNAEYVLLKTSPLLDLAQIKKELQFVYSVHVVAVHNECKELLIVCRRNFWGEPIIHAANIERDEEIFSFTSTSENDTVINFSPPAKYLYEPNAAILKAGAFKAIAVKFGLSKLHPNTHYYTSSELDISFPGRIFEIKAIVKSDTKAVAEFFPMKKANVITRNYPLAPDELKKKLKLRDGGEDYLIGATTQLQKQLYVARRVK